MAINRRAGRRRLISMPPREDSPPLLMPMVDLKAQFGAIRGEVMAAIEAVMERQQFILGPEVGAFEREMAAYLDAGTAIGCASGTDALVMALMALGIGPGDEVVTTPFTFVATAGAIARIGAKPVFADIDPQTFNIDPASAEAAIGGATRAIIAVHLFGLPADLAPLIELARRRRIALLEDAAQAIGAHYQGTRVGTFGAMGCFSFFPTKNLGGAGDGGMVATRDPELARQIRLLREHGGLVRYRYDKLGLNSRLDEIQAAVLRVKLKYLDRWTAARRAKAVRYRELFAQRGLGSFMQLPVEPPGREHVYHQFVIRCPRREELRSFLIGCGIPTQIYYPLPLHLQPAFAYLGYHPGQLPNAEAASREVLALPVYPELADQHQVTIADAVARFLAG
jgi:dTDP-4-amino-4,6-dideoxygalactose transaminase